MENKKVMIPIVLGVLLLCGIIFTVVYKKTSGPSPNDQPVVQTLAPKETKEIETRVSGSSNSSLDEFDVNETKAPSAKSLDELMENGSAEINTPENVNGSQASQNINESGNDGIFSLEGLSESEVAEKQSEIAEEYVSIVESSEVVGMDPELFNELQDKYDQELESMLNDPEIMGQLNQY